MNMQTEPIRLPAWIASLLAIVVLPFVVALLTGVEWKDALAAALAAVIPLLATVESVRAFKDSPATTAAREAEARASVRALALDENATLPVDERDHDYGPDWGDTAASTSGPSGFGVSISDPRVTGNPSGGFTWSEDAPGDIEEG